MRCWAMGLVALIVTAPAGATDVFGGVYLHDVKTPLNKAGIERGADILAGIRAAPLGRTPIQPYAFAAVHTRGQTHYAAIGLSAKFGERFYVRPGIGLAVHSGSTADSERQSRRIAFGSRILFEPELGIGVRLSDRASIEAHWIHMSHGTVFSRQNPGIDNIGVRMNVRL